MIEEKHTWQVPVMPAPASLTKRRGRSGRTSACASGRLSLWGRVPCFGSGCCCHYQGGGPVGPPPVQRVVERERSEREQARRRPDTTQSPVALERAAGHPPAQRALGIGQRREDGQRDARRGERHS